MALICYKLFSQIPITGNTAKITLIVQSQYNVTLENTSLNFEVYNSTAGGCESNSRTNTYTPIMTGIPPESDGHDQHIIIILATLAGIFAIALMVAGVILWNQKRNQKAKKPKGIWMACCNNTICFFFVVGAWKTQTIYVTLKL